MRQWLAGRRRRHHHLQQHGVPTQSTRINADVFEYNVLVDDEETETHEDRWEKGVNISAELDSSQGRVVLPAMGSPTPKKSPPFAEEPETEGTRRGRTKSLQERALLVDPALARRRAEERERKAEERKRDPIEKARVWLRGVNAKLRAMSKASNGTKDRTLNVPENLKMECPSRISSD
jgi:hypothetical protein